MTIMWENVIVASKVGRGGTEFHELTNENE
jgi:hypothetical protein